jgi:hypothetical protein
VDEFAVKEVERTKKMQPRGCIFFVLSTSLSFLSKHIVMRTGIVRSSESNMTIFVE